MTVKLILLLAAFLPLVATVSAKAGGEVFKIILLVAGSLIKRAGELGRMLRRLIVSRRYRFFMRLFYLLSFPRLMCSFWFL